MNPFKQDRRKYTTELTDVTRARIDALVFDYAKQLAIRNRVKADIYDLCINHKISPTIISRRLDIERAAITNILRRFPNGGEK